jgi:predicted nucleic acid-binding protein
MPLIVDASVAVKWFVEEEDSDLALRLLRTGNALLAPELVVAEAENAFWRYFQQGVLDPETAVLDASRIRYYFSSLVSISDLAEQAAAIAIDLGHPVYDCFYLTLAERESVPLVTADSRLLRRLQGSGWRSLVQPLSSFP